MPRPGAMSLAHGGVLFLDEVTLMPARVLDALRTPLERGEVTLLRSRHQVRYPCRVQLVMAANPCPCGAAEPGECTCPPGARRRHMAAVSATASTCSCPSTRGIPWCGRSRARNRRRSARG